METHDPTDSELVVETLAGNREAYGQLYDRHARLVRAVFCAVGMPWSLVEDLTQECFLRAYRKLGTLRKSDRFGPWMAGIARMISQEQRRSFLRDRHQFLGDGLVDVLSPDDLILEAQSAEEFHLLQEYLGVLPEGERLAIHAFFFDEQTALQAAEQMDLSRSGFYAILNRAVARLEKMFSSLDSGKESP